MDYKETQEMELEALEAIYSEELEILNTEYPNIHLKITLNSHGEGIVDAHDSIEPFNTILEMKLNDKYPDVIPEISIRNLEDLFDEERVGKIVSDLNAISEENLGMNMIYTIVSGLQDIIGQLSKELKKRAEDEFEAKLKAAEEEENKVIEGTTVTVENFNAWNKKFIAEMYELKNAEQKAKEAALQGKLTGKQQFLKDSTLFNSDLTLLVNELNDEEISSGVNDKNEEAVDIDESLFNVDDEDLELLSSDED
uniref:RWD domain-containing protein n=1 Tax=Parastrongyloides trichosuri TaxID=131310 RepID=A0A0N5A7A8_PARTI